MLVHRLTSRLDLTILERFLHDFGQRKWKLSHGKFNDLLGLSKNLLVLLSQAQLPPIQVTETEKEVILGLLRFLAEREYTTGNPLLIARIDSLRFVVTAET